MFSRTSIRWKKFGFVLLFLFLLKILFVDVFEYRYITRQCGFQPFTRGQCFTDSREHSYKYIHNEPELCNGEVFVLIMIISIPRDFTLRQTIRNTWGSFASRKSNIRLAFMLGSLESETLDKKIEQESETYHDIIQKDFIDTYRNLSLKSESILHYSAFYCQNAQYILKTDTDMFINVPLLLNNLKNSNGESILGHLHDSRKPYFDKSGKWHIEPSDYPLDYYPDYVSGTGYVIPGKYMRSLFQMSLKTKLLVMEDVYITGILRARLALPIQHNHRFHIRKCVINSCNLLNSITCHKYKIDEIVQMWKVFKKCSKM